MKQSIKSCRCSGKKYIIMQQTREHSLQHIGVSKFCKMDLFRLILIGILNWSAFVSGDQQQQGAVSALINNYRTCLGESKETDFLRNYAPNSSN